MKRQHFSLHMATSLEVKVFNLSGQNSHLKERAADTKLYCTCRTPDDGTWMINCELCEEWYHGRCINLREEDAYNIDSYACTSCTNAGKGECTLFMNSADVNTGQTTYRPPRPKRARTTSAVKSVNLFSPAKKQKSNPRDPIKTALASTLKQGLERDLKTTVCLL